MTIAMAEEPISETPDIWERDDGLSALSEVRPRLFDIACRVLGSAAEAEDIVQDVWLRWQVTDRSVVENLDPSRSSFTFMAAALSSPPLILMMPALALFATMPMLSWFRLNVERLLKRHSRLLCMTLFRPISG
jgi:Sigma-70 region 2